MKRIFILAVTSFVLLSFSGSESLKWYSLPEGIELSRIQKKPALIFVYAPWCDMCKRMEKKVFNNKDVAPLLSENFILIKINADTDTAYLKNDKILQRKFFMRDAGEGRMALGVPTTILLRSNSEDPLKIQGVEEIEDFRTDVREFLKK